MKHEIIHSFYNSELRPELRQFFYSVEDIIPV